MIVYLRGSDSFLAKETILALKKKYLEKNPDGTELIEIDASTSLGTGTSLINWADLRAIPLFATSRLIIIKRAGELLVEEQNNLASMLTDLPASSVAVIWDGKPFKTSGTLSQICNKSVKKISVEPLVGSVLNNWIKVQATMLNIKITTETIIALVEQYGSDLWAIQTDLQSRQGLGGSSSWSQTKAQKPFAIFDYVRGRKWPELRKYLIAGHRQGVAIELTIGSLAAAIRQDNRDQKLKQTMTQTLTEIDIAVKSGLIEAGDAVALLACYLPDRQKRVQWEVIYYAIN